jgi:hypothetical protein
MLTRGSIPDTLCSQICYAMHPPVLAGTKTVAPSGVVNTAPLPKTAIGLAGVGEKALSVRSEVGDAMGEYAASAGGSVAR